MHTHNKKVAVRRVAVRCIPLVLLAVCLMALLTACLDIFGAGQKTSNSSSSSTTDSTTTKKNVPPCSLVSAGEMGKIVGSSVQATEEKDKSSCVYTPGNLQSGAVNVSAIAITTQDDPTGLKFLALKNGDQGSDFKPVDGVGVEALHNSKLHTLIVEKSGVLVSISNVAPLKSEDENLAVSKQIAQVALSHL
jgi:hypothetical protein